MQTQTQAVNVKLLQGFEESGKKALHSKSQKPTASFSSLLESASPKRTETDVKYAKKAELAETKTHAPDQKESALSKKTFLSKKNEQASQKSAVEKETGIADEKAKSSKKMLSALDGDALNTPHTEKIVNAEPTITMIFNAAALSQAVQEAPVEQNELSAAIGAMSLEGNAKTFDAQSELLQSEPLSTLVVSFETNVGAEDTVALEAQAFFNADLGNAERSSIKEAVSVETPARVEAYGELARSQEGDVFAAADSVVQEEHGRAAAAHTALLSQEKPLSGIEEERFQKSAEEKQEKPVAFTGAAETQTVSKAGVFTIIDERTVEEKGAVKSLEQSAVAGREGEHGAETQGFLENASFVQAEQNILSSNSQAAGATGSTFQEMLSQQIQENAAEFVKAGSIVLKDSNSGSIQLVMKPESLGNVKISMELSDKVIAGHIVVHSKEALEAFRQNLDTLKQAFEQNGFDNAHFTLSLADSGLGNGGAFAQHEQNSGHLLAEKAYSPFVMAEEGLSDSTEAVGNSYSKSGDYQIDVVA